MRAGIMIHTNIDLGYCSRNDRMILYKAGSLLASVSRLAACRPGHGEATTTEMYQASLDTRVVCLKKKFGNNKFSQI